MRRNKVDGLNNHPWKSEVNEDDTSVPTSVISSWLLKFTNLISNHQIIHKGVIFYDFRQKFNCKNRRKRI